MFSVVLQLDSDKWNQINTGEVVLRTWEVESSHNYENNMHVTQVWHSVLIRNLSLHNY